MGGTEVQTRVAPLANGNFGGSGLQPQLPLRVLVEAADADVTDALTVQGILLREMCQEEIYDL